MVVRSRRCWCAMPTPSTGSRRTLLSGGPASTCRSSSASRTGLTTRRCWRTSSCRRTHYLEDWGTDIPDPGPGYQTIGFQQPVVRSFFESRGPHLGTKNFGDVLMTLAQVLEKDLGLDADNFKGLIENDARRLLEMDRGSVRAANEKLFWNTVLQRGGWWDTGARSDLHDPRSAQYSFPTNPQTPSTGGERRLPPDPVRDDGVDGRKRRRPPVAAGHARPYNDGHVANVGRD